MEVLETKQSVVENSDKDQEQQSVDDVVQQHMINVYDQEEKDMSDSEKVQQDVLSDKRDGEQNETLKKNDCGKQQVRGDQSNECDINNSNLDKELDAIKSNDRSNEHEIKENNSHDKQQHAMKGEHSKEQNLAKNSNQDKETKDVVKSHSHGAEKQKIKKGNFNEQQLNEINNDSSVDIKKDVAMNNNCKEQHHKTKNDTCEEQDRINIDVQSVSEKCSQKSETRKIENEKISNINNDESGNIVKQSEKKAHGNKINVNDEYNSQLSRVKQDNKESVKLTRIKREKTNSIRKLREVSQILRNKKRSRQREQIHTRHRSSSKDIAKLLKKKRNAHRQQPSTSQDDDQSTHSGTKRKRIPNRPGILFEIGARIEAKDYLDKWYPSKIIAVDEGAAEVLIHFERWSARFDEWMPMESPRIRAITHPSTRNEQKEKTCKVMPQYKAGEAVLARWTDCKMYPAKVLEVGANNCYEVLFYDGFHRTVQSLNIEKLPKEMADKVDFPSAPKSESPERKKPNPIPKEPVKPLPKKVDKTAKDRTSKRDQNDLTSILGKRKRLIVGGIFQAKRNKINDEKCTMSSKSKTKKVLLPAKQSSVEIVESNNLDETTSPASPVGYIDGRKIARKEFIIEEDHNHFKCPITSCGKSFRKDKLLQSHMKHYHDDTRSRGKKKSSSLVRDFKTVANTPSVPVSPPCEKIIEREESKAEVLKTKLKSPVKEEASKDVTKSVNAQLATSPKIALKSSTQESLKSGKISKSSRTDAKHSKTATIPEVPADNKSIAVKSDGRVTRSEKGPKIEHKTTRADNKTTRAETRHSKLDNKLSKIENKNIKTENRTTKAESKAIKVENKTESKSVKNENKSIKSENKTVKNENKIIKSENKIIKTENKPMEEKAEKSKLGQENKTAEETTTVQSLPVNEDIKNIDSGINVMSPTQTPVLPVESVHTSRSKKRRTISASEVNADSSVVDTIIHSIIPKDIDIKCEQKLIDVENLQDDVKPVITDFKSVTQEEDAEEGQSDEIVHCICNCIEENGLMMQCEVCLTWQHGACFDIDDVKEVPDKYVCYACLKPVGLRESFRYRHDLDWFSKGEMTTFSFLEEKPSPNVVNETLSTHDLVASLHNALSVLHSLQIKLKILKEDNHPDLIMWKKPWMDYSYLQSQELDNNEELVQPTRADFDHSYFSVKEDLLMSTNALNAKRNSYEKMGKKEAASSTTQEGESSHSSDKIKTSTNGGKYRPTEKERISGKQQSFIKTEVKQNVEFDPSECKKNLLNHLIQMQHVVEQQLHAIEEHLQILESEMGIPTLSDEELQKEMGKSLCTIRKLTKDLSFVQQLTNFQ